MNFYPWCTYSNKCQFFVWQFVIHDVLFFHIRECPHAEHLQHLSNVNWNIFSYSNIESVLSENTSSKALCGKRQDIFSAWTGFTNRFKIYPKPIETTWGVATLSPGFFERVRPTSNTLSTALCEKKQGIFSAWTGLTNRLLFFSVASFLPGWDSLSLDESRIFGLWIFSIVLSDSTCACVTLFCFLVRHHVLPILSD